jgi:hypothetical protein
MKIIQSFWSGKNKSITNNFGWYSYEYNWMGWILSVNQLVKFYDRVELYTDSFGYEILINRLNLPYTKVHVVLDELNELPNDLWAMAKIKTYSLQNEPFLHVDGDVFIWEKFPEELMKKNIIVQNIEKTTDYYSNMWKNIYPNLIYFPQEINDYHNGKTSNAYNMGIFGGNDYETIRNYSMISLNFVEKNKNSWNNINLFNFNIFFEQVLLYNFLNKRGIKVDVLINENIGDNEYSGFADIDDVPFDKWYLHFLGVFKQNSFPCNKLRSYLYYHYPEYLKLLSELIPEKFSYLDFPYLFTKNENQYFLSIKSNTIKENNKDLLIRDLLSVNMMQKYHTIKNDNFTICLTDSYEIIEVESIKYIKVKELENDIYKPLEDIDEIMLLELKNCLTINELKNKMLTYIDEELDNEEMSNFLSVIDNNIQIFIRFKIITIK